jgi:hypothetical protein
VPVTARVIHQATGAPATDGYDVFAWARNEQGEKTEFFPAIEQLGPNQPGGTYQAYVIVPHGGAWTLMATVNEQRSGQTLAEAGIPADVAAGVLASTTGATDPLDRYGTAASSPGADPLRAGMLWVHTLVAVAWAMAVGLLAVMATPKGRRLLSDRGSTLLDGRLPALIRAARWTTVLVVLTGVYNMVNSLAYKLPGSGAQLREVLRLPYGDAYFGALGVKLAVYGAMIAASVPLVRAARRQADSWEAGDDVPVSASIRPQPARSPWGAPAEGGVAVKERVSAPPVVAEEPKTARVILGGLALGGLIITLAVTLLKYFHVLIEAARAA